jgi:nicotinamidase-related amidase
MTRPAIIVIDMLRDFLEEDGALYCKKCREIIPNVKKLIETARRISVPVIYVSCNHSLKSKAPEFTKWGPHAIKGTKGAEVIDELKPKRGDYIVNKESYSGFYNTNLETILRSLNVDTLVLTGIHTHVCILATGLDAFYRGFNVIFPEDCIITGHSENHRTRLRFFRTHLGRVTNLRELINELTHAQHQNMAKKVTVGA